MITILILDINIYSAKRLKKAFPIYIILSFLIMTLITYFIPTTFTIIEIAYINVTVNTIFITVMIAYISYKSKPKLTSIYNRHILSITIIFLNEIAI